MTVKKSARRLRKLREAAGMSTDQLAQAAGVGSTVIRQIEYGQRPIAASLAPRLALALNVPVEDLL